MNSTCKVCEYLGNFEKCKEFKCHTQNSWYADVVKKMTFQEKQKALGVRLCNICEKRLSPRDKFCSNCGFKRR